MQYLRVRQWEDFQHYRDRDPPWIKLYNRLLDDYEFGRLQDASKSHLIGIFLLASRHQNRIPADPKWIAQRIQATAKVDLDPLLSTGIIEMIPSASVTGADCVQDASKLEADCSPERETERETEAEKKQSVARSRQKRFTPPTLEEIEDYARLRSSSVDPRAFFDFYENGVPSWHDSNGKPVLAWKQKLVTWESRQKQTAVKPQQEAAYRPTGLTGSIQRVLAMMGEDDGEERSGNTDWSHPRALPGRSK